MGLKFLFLHPPSPCAEALAEAQARQPLFYLGDLMAKVDCVRRNLSEGGAQLVRASDPPSRKGRRFLRPP
jgi:hypothetical protein